MFHSSGFSTSSKKPYTAITQYIDRLTGPEYDENDFSGIIDLIEVIRIQDTGPTEAARAVRKKLKYGTTERQLRALTILDGLISNAGPRFQRHFADEPLLERLRILPRDDMVDIDVRNKCNTLYRQWAVAYKDVRGCEQIATLYKQLPSRARPAASQSRVIRETEQEAAEDAARDTQSPAPGLQPASGSSHRRELSQSSTPVPGSGASTPPRRSSHAPPSSPMPSHPTTASSAATMFSSKHKTDKSSKHKAGKPFNLEKEKTNMLQAIAGASVASTNLTNALKLINRENQLVSEDRECSQRFEQCKLLRRQILRYIQLVESDQWIGSLLTANDELIKALMAYEVMDKSVEDDSDSETEGGGGPGHAHQRSHGVDRAQLFNDAGMAIPPRKASLSADMANMKLREEQAPAKPPRPTGSPAPAITSHAVPTPLAAGIGASGGLGKGRKIQDDDFDDDADENDPFGDQNEIK